MKYLKEIMTGKKNEIDRQVDYGALPQGLLKKPGKSLMNNTRKGLLNIIAEIKKASPSLGPISSSFELKEITETYSRFRDFICGISVITEPVYFKGKLDFIPEVKKYTSLPVLRKDFLFHEKHVYESFVAGADCILLISTLLGIKKFKKLYEYAKNMGMEVLAEVHDSRDLQKVLEAGAEFIGINNRNLKTMEIDMDNVLEVLGHADKKDLKDKVIVCESGLGNRKIEEDLEYIRELGKRGVNTFLVGTYFMQSRELDVTLESFKTLLKENGFI